MGSLRLVAVGALLQLRELELVMVAQAGHVGLGAAIERSSAGDVDGRQRLLVETDLERDLDVAEAARAGSVDRGPQVGPDQHAPIRPGDVDPTLDGSGEPEVVGQWQRDATYVEVADGPNRLGQQPGQRVRERGRDGHRGTGGRLPSCSSWP